MRYSIKFFTLLLVIIISRETSAQWAAAPIDTMTRNTLRDNSTWQSIAVDDLCGLHAMWVEDRTHSGWSIFYAKKLCEDSWTQPVEIFSGDSLKFAPALTVNKKTGQAFIAYSQKVGTNAEIFLARDSAGTWVKTRITENPLEDIAPSLTTDGSGALHLAWITGNDTTAIWKISYATNADGTWKIQRLGGSMLGEFGRGAAPRIAVTTAGTAHIFYRGGDYQGQAYYRVHHAEHRFRNDTIWNYEILLTQNGSDYTGIPFITADSTLHVLASGNDCFGCAGHVYYLKRNPGSSSWMVEDVISSESAIAGSLVVDRNGVAHAVVNGVSGNIYSGALQYATNASGGWVLSSIRPDRKFYEGSMVIDMAGHGHAIAFTSPNSLADEEVMVLHSTAGLVDVPEHQGNVPLSYLSNYPNPFSQLTVVSYQLSGKKNGIFEVKDMLGRTVYETALDDSQQELRFDASHFPAGVYLYSIWAGEYIETRRMIVVR